MLEAKITVTHEAGLQARPAALFVQVANRFTSRIWITKVQKLMQKAYWESCHWSGPG